jgi:hypothetical protein
MNRSLRLSQTATAGIQCKNFSSASRSLDFCTFTVQTQQEKSRLHGGQKGRKDRKKYGSELAMVFGDRSPKAKF